LLRQLEDGFWPSNSSFPPTLSDRDGMDTRPFPRAGSERQLTQRRSGVATVVYHSIMWHYLADDTQKAARAAIKQADTRATTDAPHAWLALEFEAEGQPPELTLTQWPGGTAATSQGSPARRIGQLVAEQR
jgi:hypothetical protein